MEFDFEQLSEAKPSDFVVESKIRLFIIRAKSGVERVSSFDFYAAVFSL